MDVIFLFFIRDTKMSKKLEKFYKTEEGKEILEENLKNLYKDLKNEKGWFSPEEDEYWNSLYVQI